MGLDVGMLPPTLQATTWEFGLALETAMQARFEGHGVQQKCHCKEVPSLERWCPTADRSDSALVLDPEEMWMFQFSLDRIWQSLLDKMWTCSEEQLQAGTSEALFLVEGQVMPSL